MAYFPNCKCCKKTSSSSSSKSSSKSSSSSSGFPGCNGDAAHSACPKIRQTFSLNTLGMSCLGVAMPNQILTVANRSSPPDPCYPSCNYYSPVIALTNGFTFHYYRWELDTLTTLGSTLYTLFLFHSVNPADFVTTCAPGSAVHNGTAAATACTGATFTLGGSFCTPTMVSIS